MDRAVPATSFDDFDWEGIHCKNCDEDVPGWITFWAGLSPFPPQQGFKPCVIIPMQICPFCGNITMHPKCLSDITGTMLKALEKETKH